MKYISFISSFLIAAALTLPFFILSCAALTVSADSAVLYEPVTGTFLYEKNATTRRGMASTTKIMTALIAIETGNLSRQITVPPEAVGIEGSSVYLKEGETLTLEDLLYALLLQSANDAAVAIACAVGGSTEEFCDLMNRKVTELGLSDTHFDNPHGLDSPDHYTTAADLARIAAYALEHPVFREIVSTKKRVIYLPMENASRVLVNHNKLLRLYDDSIGVKTGFTRRCGRCLVGAAERDGLSLITVTLDAPNDWNDHISLFDYGFSSMESRVLAEPYSFRYTMPVIGGDKPTVTIANTEQVRAVLPRTAVSPTPEVYMQHLLTAPLRSGEVVGTVLYWVNGHVVASDSLVVTEPVERGRK